MSESEDKKENDKIKEHIESNSRKHVKCLHGVHTFSLFVRPFFILCASLKEVIGKSTTEVTRCALSPAFTPVSKDDEAPPTPPPSGSVVEEREKGCTPAREKKISDPVCAVLAIDGLAALL